jgi:hypothetical protein
MQDRYVADVGDFGKYGLLRAIGRDFKLGVVWYLTPDESHNEDGKYTTFLNPTPKNLDLYRACDPDLYDALGDLLDGGQRSVAAVRQTGVLPNDTTFFEDRLTFAGMPNIGPAARDARLRLRLNWLGRALSQTESAEFIFLDPDNGFAFGTKSHEAKGPKYVYFNEVQPYLDREQSVIVYHHLNRNATADVQVELMLGRIRTELADCGAIHALRFHRGSPRVFFMIPTAAHEEIVRKRLAQFMCGPWSAHFTHLGEAPVVQGVLARSPSRDDALGSGSVLSRQSDFSATFIDRARLYLEDVLAGMARRI